MSDHPNDTYWFLKAIKAIGGSRNWIEISSGELARYMKISQQSASRMILSLLKEGLITRQMNGRRQELSITGKGMNVLMKEYTDLGTLIEKPTVLKIAGMVQSGLGEGRYYISRKYYIVQFQEKLGYIPYLGTLNVKISPASEIPFRKLRSMDGMHIDGFVTEDRTFGPVKCFHAHMGSTRCAIIFPERSVYSDVMEIISEDYLREKFSLADGQEISVEVDGPFN